MRLNKPVVGMAATPSGRGYWLVASDGGVFAFGDATFDGSTGALHLVAPVTGIAATTSGDGYWMSARDGGIFAFGGAPYLGRVELDPRVSVGTVGPVVGIAADPGGSGYAAVEVRREGTARVYTFAVDDSRIPGTYEISNATGLSFA